MIPMIKERFWWPTIRQDCIDCAKTCIFCQQAKSGRRRNVGKQKLFSCTEPNEMIAVDIAGPMPISKNGNIYVIGILDRFSRFMILIPTKDDRAITSQK